jgi:hypothetical protein
MMQRKVISLPTNQSKVYRQILAFMNFMLNLTPQERDVLAEIIRLDNEYEALPVEKRAKFILSTDMRKEMREALVMEEKQFNVVISRLKKKLFFGKPLLDDKNILHPELKYKPDSEGFKIEINFVMTAGVPTTNQLKVTEELVEEELSNEVSNQESNQVSDQVPPVEYKHDASKAPVLEEEEFDFTISSPDE